MNNINITIKNRVATADASSKIICNNEDFTVTFTFDDEWEGVDMKTARFWCNGGYTDVIFEGNTCTAPPARRTRVMDIGVFANGMSTTPAYVPCVTDIKSLCGREQPPQKDVYDQLVGMFQEVIDRTQNVAEAADRANTAAESAEGASALAEEMAARAEQAITDAESHAPVIECAASGAAVAVNDSAHRPLRGLSIYGKTTQNGTPTPDAPVELVKAGSLGSVRVEVSGKNLLPADGETETMRGITLTNNGDGSFTATGTSTGTVGISLVDLSEHTLRLYSGITYTQSIEVLQGTKPQGALIVPAFKDDVDEISYNFFTDNQTRTANKNFIMHSYTMYMGEGVTCDFTFRVQLEVGDTATEWEAYKGKQQLVHATPNGLCGIPVLSGGNYTDSNGQQWVCDEIDFARGVYVQRVEEIEAYAGEAVGGAWMSSTGALSAGANVLYALSAPVETELPAEQLAAYAALRTNYPHTTVLNDAGAGMKLTYAADTKVYIDNKIAAMMNA